MGRNSRTSRGNTYNGGHGTQDKMARTLDKLEEFTTFCEDVAPKLQQMLKDGKTAKEIYKWGENLAAAKTVSLIIRSDDKTSLAASKEVLDRSAGKAADNINITKKYEDLTDEELEQVLRSKREDLEESSKEPTNIQ